jgi:SAM-dependent methyltransferase
MTNTDFITTVLAPYQPQLPMEELVLEVNRLYHAVEAQDYDDRHPEVHEQLPPIWKEMIDRAVKTTQIKEWRILDFGCGTGFEAEQLIRHLPQGSIAQLMLACCRARITPLFADALFVADLSSQPGQQQPYNLLATNSLLHHLPNPLNTINHLLPQLSKNVLWLAGHEPSSRFYKNAECSRLYKDFLQQRRWSRFLSVENYLAKIRQLVGLASNPSEKAAKAAFHKGLFKQQPSSFVVDRLVDFHVAHSLEEASQGRGFDFKILQQEFADSWQLEWVKTYSFMGSFYEQDLSSRWSDASREMSQRFGDDGANFCTVWRRN